MMFPKWHNLNIPTARKRRILFVAALVALPVMIYLLVPLPSPLFPDDYSTVVVDEAGHILRAFLNSDEQWYFPPDPKLKIPAKLETCILHYEDRYFYHHPGVNPVSLGRALITNLTSGSVRSGASTLTMQVIRLATKKRRNIWNKFVEVLQALKLEVRHRKSTILRMYVNHAPYGGNIIGYQAAALRYFKKQPERLTWSEAATLAVLPNSPGLISPVMNRPRLIDKRNRLLKKLRERGIFDADTHDLAVREPLPAGVSTFFLSAPHFAQTEKDRLNRRSGWIVSTLVKNHQIQVSRLMKQHLNYLQSRGIKNGAALVVETETGRVRAYVGSQDFFDETSGGQNDGVRAPRSTGSILKPFLYALALDEALVLPSTKIRDIPSYFGSFSPVNASHTYDGLVTAKEALIRSLNVPASRLLNGYGLYKFFLFLKTAGMDTLFRQADEYGLTLILGGAEATLFDLTRLYRGLGRGGRFSALQTVHRPQSEPNIHGGGRDIQLISPQACLLTLNMLKEVKRPGAEYYWQQYQNQYPIAWKTGTSYGQRDAWSVGVTPKWTIAVWVGNFNGEGNPNITGASCAAPLMFDIFNYLPKGESENWFFLPRETFARVSICQDTGFAASDHCPHVIRVDAPRTAKPLRKCPYHQTLFVTLDEKFQVCSLCWKPGEYKKIQRLIYTPDVTQYMRDRGTQISPLPPHKPGCPGMDERNPLQIIYPVNNAKLWIPRDFHGELQRVTLRVAHRVKNRTVYWYLDDIYQGVTHEKHKMVSSLKKGWHRLEVVDGEGNRDHRRFFISIRSDSQ